MAIIGIEPGTTNSLACVCREGKAVLMSNSLGENLTSGADIDVDENGRGFRVKYYGTNTWFGYEPEVEFKDLQRLY